MIEASHPHHPRRQWPSRRNQTHSRQPRVAEHRSRQRRPVRADPCPRASSWRSRIR